MESSNFAIKEILASVGLSDAALPSSFMEEALHLGETKLIEKLGFVKAPSAPNTVSYLLIENGANYGFCRACEAPEGVKVASRHVLTPIVDEEFFGVVITKVILKRRLKEWKSVIKD